MKYGINPMPTDKKSRPKEDLTLRNFGGIRILGYCCMVGSKHYWWALCTHCGKEFPIRTDLLVHRHFNHGHKLSCGCKETFSNGNPRWKGPKDSLVGNRIDKVVVRELLTKNFEKGGGYLYICDCDCGAVIVLPDSSLKAEKGYAACSDCKTLRAKEMRSKGTMLFNSIEPVVEEEESSCPRMGLIYNIWRCMVRRCKNPMDPLYSKYGALGIRVKEDWYRNFSSFKRDLPPKPEILKDEDCWIGRENPELDYTNGNIIWVYRDPEIKQIKEDGTWYE